MTKIPNSENEEPLEDNDEIHGSGPVSPEPDVGDEIYPSDELETATAYPDYDALEGYMMALELWGVGARVDSVDDSLHLCDAMLEDRESLDPNAKDMNAIRACIEAHA